MSKSTVTRRSFFKKSVTGLAGAGLILSGRDTIAAVPVIHIPQFQNVTDLKVKMYRPLGKLGFTASDISIGTTGQTDPSFVSFALDCGINYIDTAHSYGNGKAEEDIGKGLKDRRDKVWINTKFGRFAFRSQNVAQGLIDSLNESLSRMKIDHVDSVMVHNGKPDQMFIDELHTAFDTLKKAGKVKYLGVSLHDSDAADIFAKAVDDGRFHIILTVYGAYSAQSSKKYFKKAYDNGIAVVAMKTLGAAYNAKVKGWDKLQKRGTGGGMWQHGDIAEYTPAFMQSAFAWVLDNPYISCMVKRMNSTDDVKNCVSASGVKYSFEHQQFLDYYGSLIEGNYCTMGCVDCLASCPNNVAINSIMRYKMYFENYRSEKEGIISYKNLPSQYNAEACMNCSGFCKNACPNGLDIKSELIHTHDLLTL